jgi:hypothetical protein
MDFTPGRDLPDPRSGSVPSMPNLDKVKDALDSVAGAVNDAVNDAVDKVGKAIGAGAADKPDPE